MGGTIRVSEARLDREPLVRSVAGLATGGWDPEFQNDVEKGAWFVVARAIALVGPGIDCVVSFGRVALSSITETNPRRVAVTSKGGYPNLRRRLETDPSYDSVPLSFGRSSRGIALWDGHRRMETYRAAGRSDVPAWVATFRLGSGAIRLA